MADPREEDVRPLHTTMWYPPLWLTAARGGSFVGVLIWLGANAVGYEIGVWPVVGLLTVLVLSLSTDHTKKDRSVYTYSCDVCGEQADEPERIKHDQEVHDLYG